MAFDPEITSAPGARIKVVGVGGGGTNAINTMIRQNIEGVDFISINTDVQSLRFSLAPKKIQIGKELTKGLGAGADPDIGRDAALEDRHDISEQLANADMVFITAGMGGGTGTGGAAIVSQIAREQGALTVGVVTKPFDFEGKRRKRHAEIGIARMREHVDTLIIIPNQRLLQIATPDLSMMDAFKMADSVLVNAVRGISDIINVPGQLNVDFADVRTIMASMGQALMGIGTASGPNRAEEAARQAISSPMIEDIEIDGATGVLINISSGSQLGLLEIEKACSIIRKAAHEDANIIFGAVIDENMGDELRVTVIATGFPAEAEGESPKDITGRLSSQNSVFEQRMKAKSVPPLVPHNLTRDRRPPIEERPQQKPSNPPPVSSFLQEPSSHYTEEEAALAELTMKHASVASKGPKIEESIATESVERFPQLSFESQKPTPVIENPAKKISDDIDRKIEEALKMAERVKESMGTMDDLDVPAFLRTSVKELPLD